MTMLFRAALGLSALLAAPASAQSAARPVPPRMQVSDPANASYTLAPDGGPSESSSAASFTFSRASQALARGFYAICPTAGTISLTGVNGGAVTGWPLVAGLQYHPLKIAGFAGNSTSSPCTIGELF